jgi:hypothetical protein
MSTKTSFKRVALVAVAALGMGVLTSVSPASATATVASDLSSITLVKATTTPVVGQTVVLSLGIGASTASNTETTTITAYASSYPTGGRVSVIGSETSTGTSVVIDTAEWSGQDELNGSLLLIASANPAAVVASSTAGVGVFTFTPTKAGDYVISAWNDADQDGIVDVLEVSAEIKVTVAATPGLDLGQTTLFANALGAEPTAGTTTTYATSGSYVSKEAGSQAGAYKITLMNSLGSALDTTDGVLTADVSGPGLLTIAQSNTDYTNSGTATKARSVNLGVSAALTDHIVNVHLWSDGTAGKSTVTFTYTDADGVSTVVGTKSAVFYGAIAKIVAVQNHKIAKSTASALGSSSAAPTGADADNTPAVTLTVTDKDGNLVSDLTTSSLKALSSNTAVMTQTIAVTESNGTGPGDGYAGPGHYNVQVNSSTNTSGKTATLTFRALGADGVTYVNSEVLTYTLGGSIAKAVLTLDKATYSAGEKAVATITATDSAGNAAWDTVHTAVFSASTGLTSSLSLPSAVFAATTLSTTGGKATAKINAPSVAGSWELTGTALTAPLSALSAKASVSGSADTAALTTLVNSLITKINAMQKLLNKIQKKLGVK